MEKSRHVTDLSKRRFFSQMGVVMLGSASLPWSKACVDSPPHLHVVSEHGCGRATGYAEANKIVTIDGKTHVAWLDSVGQGFVVRIRTFDRRLNTWSETVTLGEAHDNHGGPSLAIDSKGFLHVVYYPHHHAMRYRRSKHPNNVSSWTREVTFGDRLTYPTLLCGPQDVLYCTCRRSYKEKPWEVELWKKWPDSDWILTGSILRSRYMGYAHFQESLAWNPIDWSLHLACRFHEKSDDGAYGRLQSVVYLKSVDLGSTWQAADGGSVRLPAVVDDLQPLASGGLDAGNSLRAGAIAVDQFGAPYLVYSIDVKGVSETYFATYQGATGWSKTRLNGFLPDIYRDWSMTMPGGVSINASDEIYVVAQIHQRGVEKPWGHASNEVVVLYSKNNGSSFACSLISDFNKDVAHWLPNIERPTSMAKQSGSPAVVFTAGSAGQSNSDILSNEVYLVCR